jgi:hypothetical protein
MDSIAEKTRKRILEEKPISNGHVPESKRWIPALGWKRPIPKVLNDDEFDQRLLEEARLAQEDVSRQVGLGALLKRRAKKPSREIKPPPILEVKGPPSPDCMTDWKTMAKVLFLLQHDSPEKTALLNKIGLRTEDLSSRLFASLGRSVLEITEEDEPGRTLGKWEDLPYPNRDSLPRAAGINTRRLCEVDEREMEWLWEQRIPKGKISIISGDPDLGKTWVVLDIMARLTTGRSMPDGSPNPFTGLRRHVLWVSAEDDDEDTIKPRFRILQGDDTRFHTMQFVLARELIKGKKDEYASVERSLKLDEDLDRLDDWLADHPEVIMVGLDPLMAFLGRTDSHRYSDVRALLDPLRKLAHKHGVAIVGINHLYKGVSDNAMYRSIGSIAFVAAARSSWLVSKDPKRPKDRRLFTKVKTNDARRDVGGLAFLIRETTEVISWEQGRVETTANEALQVPDENSRAPARKEAKEWLREVLKEGPVLADDIWDKARADHMCEKTIKVAKKEIGVRTEKTGGRGKPWQWSLPTK